jgi:hypothetical protein
LLDNKKSLSLKKIIMVKQKKLNQIREGLLEVIKEQILTDLDGYANLKPEEGRDFFIEFDYQDILVTIEGSWTNHCTGQLLTHSQKNRTDIGKYL